MGSHGAHRTLAAPDKLIRLHRSLGDQPPAPEAREPRDAPCLDEQGMWYNNRGQVLTRCYVRAEDPPELGICF